MLLPVGIMGVLEFQLSHDSNRQQHTYVTPEAVNTVYMLLMMSDNIARNMYSSQGIINYSTQLHLVGRFRKIYIIYMSIYIYIYI
jgi:hypothetical protein